MTHENFHTFVKGTVGAATPLLAAIVSLLDQLEQIIRIFGLLGGLVVCGLTIRSLLREKK